MEAEFKVHIPHSKWKKGRKKETREKNKIDKSFTFTMISNWIQNH